jgi:hypothetical protein
MRGRTKHDYERGWTRREEAEGEAKTKGRETMVPTRAVLRFCTKARACCALLRRASAWSSEDALWMSCSARRARHAAICGISNRK